MEHFHEGIEKKVLEERPQEIHRQKQAKSVGKSIKRKIQTGTCEPSCPQGRFSQD